MNPSDSPYFPFSNLKSRRRVCSQKSSSEVEQIFKILEALARKVLGWFVGLHSGATAPLTSLADAAGATIQRGAR